MEPSNPSQDRSSDPSRPTVSGPPTISDREAATPTEGDVRKGNPFRPGSESESSTGSSSDGGGVTAAGEIVWTPESGVASAAAWACAAVLPFAAACLVFFPGGGVLVSGLGSFLGLAGLVSRHAVVAGLLAACHVGIGIACYRAMLG